MDSVDNMSNEQSLTMLIENILKEIIESAIESTARRDKITIKESVEINEDTVIETEIESVVEAVVDELIESVCQSLNGGGDASEGLPAPTLIVVDIIDALTEIDSKPDNEAEVRNTFGDQDQVGWLDAGEVPAAQKLAPRKRKGRLAAVWRGIKRFFLCGCCIPRAD